MEIKINLTKEQAQLLGNVVERLYNRNLKLVGKNLEILSAQLRTKIMQDIDKFFVLADELKATTQNTDFQIENGVLGALQKEVDFTKNSLLEEIGKNSFAFSPQTIKEITDLTDKLKELSGILPVFIAE